MLRRLPSLIIINAPASSNEPGCTDILNAFCKKHNVHYHDTCWFLSDALMTLTLNPEKQIELSLTDSWASWFDSVHPDCTTNKTMAELGVELRHFCNEKLGLEFIPKRIAAEIPDILSAYPHVLIVAQSNLVFKHICANMPSHEFRLVQIHTNGKFEVGQEWIVDVPANVIDFRINSPESNLLALEALFA